MFKSISTRLIQHLISQNSWANAILQPFAGKSVQFNVAFMSTSLVILENGGLAVAGETNIADAIVTIPPGLLIRLMAKDEAAKLQICVEGDTHLTAELAKVLANMRWDYEDDLSKLVGDIPANKIGSFARKATHSMKETSINLAEMLSEYWQEEKPMIAKKRHVEEFNAQVDTLRADVARYEKKLAQYIQKHTKKYPMNSDLNDTAVDSTH
jgi:ubiquinone biosynthesis accessory factor UbiJ